MKFNVVIYWRVGLLRYIIKRFEVLFVKVGKVLLFIMIFIVGRIIKFRNSGICLFLFKRVFIVVDKIE